MSATLHRLQADEAAELASEVERGYAEDMELRGGIPRDAARRKAAADCAKLLTDETAAAYRVDVEGEPVGHLWVGEQDSLNVFDGNEVARRLYGSLGYDEVAVVMRKHVG